MIVDRVRTSPGFAEPVLAPPAAAEADAHWSEAGGRRDRKKRATRRAIRNAALDLVAEHGFAHVTVEDIAEAADVATRTFFNYFPSKMSAVVGADPERIDLLRVGLLARPPEESPLEALRSVTVEYAAALEEEMGDLGEGREAWARRFRIVREDPDMLGAYSAHIVEVERSVVDALAERVGTDPVYDPYPALVTATVFAASRVAALYWSVNGGTDSLARLTGAAIDSLSNGLVDKMAFAAPGETDRTTVRRNDGVTPPQKTMRSKR